MPQFERIMGYDLISLNAANDDWGLYQGFARGPVNTMMIFRGRKNDCRLFALGQHPAQRRQELKAAEFAAAARQRREDSEARMKAQEEVELAR